MSKIARMLNVNHLGLPRLPVPALDDTLARYTASIRPLATDAEFNEHCEIVKAFGNGVGKELQSSLVARDKAYEEKGERPFFHFEEYWDDAYLCARCPNTVHISPYYIFNRPSQSAGVENAARLIHSLTQWLVTTRAEGVKDDGGDVSQVAMFLGTTRVPQLDRDSLQFHADTSSHIIVQRSGQFYKVEVIKNNTAVSVAELVATFNAIKDDTAAPAGYGTQSIAALTTEDRNVWAAAREQLINSSQVNKMSLEEVDSALLMVALDHGNAKANEGDVSMSKSLIHGATVDLTYKNRWYDKHQLVVDDAGNTGFIFEHSFSDGGSWNKVLADVWATCTGNHETTGGNALPMQKLSWELSDKTLNSISAAEAKLRKELESEVNISILRFETYGKNQIKKWGVSPDAFVQQAFQVAYQSIHGKPAATYEAAAMRGFFHGRTETIRSLTTAGDEFARSMARGQDSKEVLREKLIAAAKAQSAIAKAASTGQGIDRHLMSLKMEATHHGVVDPSSDDMALFSTPLYSASSTWTLSTSNVTAPFIDYFGFGPVTTHGYGLGYMTFNDHLPINISTFKSGEANSRDMRDGIDMALRKMGDLF